MGHVCRSSSSGRLAHFWALSLKYEDDYRAAGVPMLPVVAGRQPDVRPHPVVQLVTVGVSVLLIPVAGWGGSMHRRRGWAGRAHAPCPEAALRSCEVAMRYFGFTNAVPRCGVPRDARRPGGARLLECGRDGRGESQDAVLALVGIALVVWWTRTGRGCGLREFGCSATASRWGSRWRSAIAIVVVGKRHGVTVLRHPAGRAWFA